MENVEPVRLPGRRPLSPRTQKHRLKRRIERRFNKPSAPAPPSDAPMGEFLGQGSALRVIEASRRRAREQCELEGSLRSTTAPHGPIERDGGDGGAAARLARLHPLPPKPSSAPHDSSGPIVFAQIARDLGDDGPEASHESPRPTTPPAVDDARPRGGRRSAAPRGAEALGAEPAAMAIAAPPDESLVRAVQAMWRGWWSREVAVDLALSRTAAVWLQRAWRRAAAARRIRAAGDDDDDDRSFATVLADSPHAASVPLVGVCDDAKVFNNWVEDMSFTRELAGRATPRVAPADSPSAAADDAADDDASSTESEGDEQQLAALMDDEPTDGAAFWHETGDWLGDEPPR